LYTSNFIYYIYGSMWHTDVIATAAVIWRWWWLKF